MQKVLAGKSPHDRAVELIDGTHVREVAFRRRLYEGGAAAVSAANDPMIELARLVDPEARALRKVAEEQDEAKQQAHAAISRARNALLGTSGYPDATFTLRLAFGTVKGYEEDRKPVPAFTTLGGLYERASEMKNRPPFELPAVWEKRQANLNLATPFNFVSTCDIIGGNSGSPVVNRAGEFVGIIFDGNLESLPWDYAFDDKQGRATSVDSASIIEALDKVYDVRGHSGARTRPGKARRLTTIFQGWHRTVVNQAHEQSVLARVYRADQDAVSARAIDLGHCAALVLRCYRTK